MLELSGAKFLLTEPLSLHTCMAASMLCPRQVQVSVSVLTHTCSTLTILTSIVITAALRIVSQDQRDVYQYWYPTQFPSLAVDN